VENPFGRSITLSRHVLVLALDTTTRSGSVAVVEDGAIRAELTGDASRTHCERLPSDLMAALDLASRTLEDIDLLAVAAGPGSFTGLRVGIAAIQGLAMATGKLVVPVSALDALAGWASSEAGRFRLPPSPQLRRTAEASAEAGQAEDQAIAAWMDAQRGEVFAALYDRSGAHALGAPTSLTPDRTLDQWTGGGPRRFIGDGAVRYEAVIRRRVGSDAVIAAAPPLAGVIGRLAAAQPDRAVLPHAVVPIYVRRSDAELARARRGE
jgi:tRNA threonylcarbamoyladenosine biosynthesis protein TsaB